MLLQMRAASFAQGSRVIVQPQTLSLAEHERLALGCAGDLAASALAMMASGVVKASTGHVFVGAFDPRIQPVQAKRLATLVPYAPLTLDFPSFERYIEYRAALWGLPFDESVVRARRIVEQLDGVHEAFAYPLAGALITQPRLLVLDRPQIAYGARIAAVAKHCAVFSTHASVAYAEEFNRVTGAHV